jgi:hypothetical protein
MLRFRDKVQFLLRDLLQLLGVITLLASVCLAAGSQLGGGLAVNSADEVLVAAKETQEPGSAALLLAGALLLGSAAIGRKIRGSSDPSADTKEP